MRASAGVIVALVSAVAIVFAAGSSAADKNKGEFEGLQAGLPIDGKAEIKRLKDGTEVKIVVRGLEPGATYAAHLHSQPCSASPPGGGHYMNDPNGPTEPPNELWLSSTDDPKAGITANSGGVAHGRGSATWVASSDPLSVVVHVLPSKDRIACADLG